jgi:uncharacterized repeat protein (TIGR02543 family)
MNEDKKIIRKEEEKEKERKRKKAFWLWFLLGLVLVISISAFGFITFSSSTSSSSSTASSVVSSSSSSSSTPSSSSSSSIPIANITITFNTNGGTAITTITAQPGSAINAPANPTRSGYTFAGWFSDEALSNAYTFPATMPSENITLYAKWTITSLMMDALPTSMGQNYSGSLTSEGRVFVWGLNGSGQLGDGTTTNRNKPVEITSRFDLAPSDKIQSLHFGANHSSAISSLGRVFIWGWNFNSRLGFNDTTNRITPTEITSLFNLDSSSNESIQSITLGWASSFALTSIGRVFSWGENSLGQLGDGTNIPKGSPVDITSKFLFDPNTNEKVTYLSSSYESIFALTSAGKIFAWGDNSDGKLGDDTTTNRNTPTNITSRFGLLNGEVVQSIGGSGLFHTVALTNQSRVFTFGNNSNGQLGNGSSSTIISKTPIDITSSFSLSGGETILELNTGWRHSIIRTSLGRIMSWGRNSDGQLGNGNTTNQFTPINIADQFVLQNGETIKSISLGYNHSFAVTSVGRLFGWGINSSNQLGDELTVNRNVPFVIPIVEPNV